MLFYHSKYFLWKVENMVDSRNFKKLNQTNNSSRFSSGIKKNPMIPFVIIVILALALIALNYFMMDILQWANDAATSSQEETTTAVQMIQNSFVFPFFN